MSLPAFRLAEIGFAASSGRHAVPLPLFWVLKWQHVGVVIEVYYGDGGKFMFMETHKSGLMTTDYITVYAR